MEMSFMKNMFGPIKSGMCRLSMDGSIAVKTSNGYKTYNAAAGTFINCDSFVFDIGEEMFFVIPTNDAKVGDIILASGKPRYVMKVDDNMLTTLNYESGAVENILPERHMFMGNTYFYGKIVSMFGNMATLAGGSGADNVMKYMMMSQMMKGMGGGSGDTMNPMFMMMMMNGGMGDMFGGIFSTPTRSGLKEVKPEINTDEIAEKVVKLMGKKSDVEIIDENVFPSMSMAEIEEAIKAKIKIEEDMKNTKEAK